VEKHVTGRLTQIELETLFGEKIPIEAMHVIFNSPDDWTIGQVREKLKEIAKEKSMQYVNHSARRYPSPIGEYVILAVLVLDYAKKYRCYAGIVPDVSYDDPSYSEFTGWIMANGLKISFSEAIQHFPGLRKEEYEY
jgi:hypothetical protein